MEHSELEFKSVWTDDILKVICAFANTSGGTLEIGKNNAGKVIGLANAKELLDIVPKKISNAMMITPDVALHDENGKQYIVITVKQYPTPVAYKGKYYARSGSNTIELTGNELTEFLLRAQGKTWDGVPIPDVSIADDLSVSAYKAFYRQALQSKRLKKEDTNLPLEVLLENLKVKTASLVKRAAVMCFGTDPERWVTEAYIKIGFFDNEVDVRYQDEVHGALIEMADKTLDLLYTKYFKGLIHYEGIQRVEDFPVPYEAMREAVLNAIVHNDYSRFNPIRIRVYENKVIISNMAKLPEDISFEKLLISHESFPHNPNIARVFYRSGQIEEWGRGITKIKTVCEKDGKPAPVFSNEGGLFKVEFNRYKIESNPNDVETNTKLNENTVGRTAPNPVLAMDTIELTETQRKILVLIEENPTITIKQLAERIGIANRNVESNLKNLKRKGIVERVGARKKGKWIVKKQLCTCSNNCASGYNPNCTCVSNECHCREKPKA
jgi:ATP-dependent DNA helicase RecG